jgi:hypothetical protein
MSQLTFKELKKRVSLELTKQSKLFERLYNKPFWIWDQKQHREEDINTNGDCCLIILSDCRRRMALINLSMTMNEEYLIH